MRVEVLQLRGANDVVDGGRLPRAAIRQLERAELYFSAVAAMELHDAEVRRSIGRLVAETRALRAYLDRLTSPGT